MTLVFITNFALLLSVRRTENRINIEWIYDGHAASWI